MARGGGGVFVGDDVRVVGGVELCGFVSWAVGRGRGGGTSAGSDFVNFLSGGIS